MRRGTPPSPALGAACTALAAGRLVVYPTETFYGVGARALLPAAVRAVAALKERTGADAAPAKPISVIVADRAMTALVVAYVPAVAAALMTCFWPGPLTLVLPARDDLPVELTAGTGHVGVRASSHPVARALVAALGEPVTATSANRAGEPAACDVATARQALGAAVDVYVDGGVLAGGSGSTVLRVDDDGARVVRVGAVSIEALRGVLGAFPLAIPS
ncbi:MAG: threonylcarbamoyl-AMP synthase [Deltaproteobacteria bacterium]|nr:threonylcarbamoyl-AMP synthase [Deltaproteobacteria bacterium]